MRQKQANSKKHHSKPQLIEVLIVPCSRWHPSQPTHQSPRVILDVNLRVMSNLFTKMALKILVRCIWPTCATKFEFSKVFEIICE